MADCNRIMADNNIKSISYDNLYYLAEKFVTENESSINLSQINILQKIEDVELPERNNKHQLKCSRVY
jgi:hypothetical protein